MNLTDRASIDYSILELSARRYIETNTNSWSGTVVPREAVHGLAQFSSLYELRYSSWLNLRYWVIIVHLTHFV